MITTFDDETPGLTPPVDADDMLWRLAYYTSMAHLPDPQGMCLATLCRTGSQQWPCGASRLSARAFIDARSDRPRLGEASAECDEPDRADST